MSVSSRRSRSLMTLRDLGVTGATAARLLDAFGDIDDILDAPSEELLGVRGVGEQTVRKIQRARAPFTVPVEIDEATFEAIERQLDRGDVDEETAEEWILGAVRRRAMEDFCK